MCPQLFSTVSNCFVNWGTPPAGSLALAGDAAASVAPSITIAIPTANVQVLTTALVSETGISTPLVLYMTLAQRGSGERPAANPIDSTRSIHGTDDHDATLFNQAKEWESASETIEARFNQQLVDADGNAVTAFRPDAQRTRLRADGKKVVDVLEVQSSSQNDAFMIDKIQQIRDALGDQAGIIEWIEPVAGATRNL